MNKATKQIRLNTATPMRLRINVCSSASRFSAMPGTARVRIWASMRSSVATDWRYATSLMVTIATVAAMARGSTTGRWAKRLNTFMREPRVQTGASSSGPHCGALGNSPKP